MSLVDSHAHLTMLTHSPLSHVLERARLAGLTKIITVSTEESNWESNRRIAKEFDWIYFTLGLHPHEAVRFAECAGKLYENVNDPTFSQCVAIGEMGLDYHYEFAPREIQIDVFESQLILANRLGLPVVIHCREAFADLYSSIRRCGLSPRGGVLHCFTGSQAEADEGLALGLSVSFSGIVTFKNSLPLQAVAKRIPLQSFLVETDCPYLAPVPYRGKPNEPSYLTSTVGYLAQIRNMSVEEISEHTAENAIKLFRLVS